MVKTPKYLKTIVVSTRIRLARNLAGFPFPSKMSEEHASEVLYLVSEGLKNADPYAYEYKYYEIDKLSASEASLAQEQYLISPALLHRGRGGAAFVSPDQTISIMVNEEDHLREQYICKGFDLHGAYERLSALDDGLAGFLDFAYECRLGYLTACPSNVGTGMRASVMLFLPGLTWSGGLKPFIRILKANGMTLRGAFGEGTKAEGYLYQLSNERTLGQAEEEILAQVSEYTMRLCDLELRARDEIMKTEETEMRDRCLRAYGALTNCALLDLPEFLTKIADVRAGIAFGFLEAKDMEGFETFLDDMRPAAFCLNNNLEGETERFYDEVRAETVGAVLPRLVRVVRRGNR